MACLSTTNVGLACIPKCCNAKTITKHSPSSVYFITSSFSSPKKLSTPFKVDSCNPRNTQGVVVIRAAETMTTEKLGIKIVKNPPESKLTDLGVRTWPKWGCPPSNFPWTYSSKETCFLLKGKVKVYPDGSDEAVEFGAGDLVEFPKGMSCTWDVSEAVDKHYNFE